MKTFYELVLEYVEYRKLLLSSNDEVLNAQVSYDVENAFNIALVWNGVPEYDEAALALFESELLDARVALLENKQNE